MGKHTLEPKANLVDPARERQVFVNRIAGTLRSQVPQEEPLGILHRLVSTVSDMVRTRAGDPTSHGADPEILPPDRSPPDQIVIEIRNRIEGAAAQFSTGMAEALGIDAANAEITALKSKHKAALIEMLDLLKIDHQLDGDRIITTPAAIETALRPFIEAHGKSAMADHIEELQTRGGIGAKGGHTVGTPG